MGGGAGQVGGTQRGVTGVDRICGSPSLPGSVKVPETTPCPPPPPAATTCLRDTMPASRGCGSSPVMCRSPTSAGPLLPPLPTSSCFPTFPRPRPFARFLF